MTSPRPSLLLIFAGLLSVMSAAPLSQAQATRQEPTSDPTVIQKDENIIKGSAITRVTPTYFKGKLAAKEVDPKRVEKSARIGRSFKPITSPEHIVVRLTLGIIQP